MVNNYALPLATTPPGIAAIERGAMWMIGVGGAIVFIEPSPYDLATLTGIVIFFATALRMQPVFMPLLVLLVVMNLGYTICSAYLMDNSEIVNWVLTSWYMAVTVIFFATALSEDTASRLDALPRGLIVGAVIASVAGVAGYTSCPAGTTFSLSMSARVAHSKTPMFSAPTLFCQRVSRFNRS